MFTINADNCLFLCSCLRVHVGSLCLYRDCSPSPDPSSARHRHLLVECGIHGQQNTNPSNLQCCSSTEAETGFVPTPAQFFAASTFLILRSLSWTRSCIQKQYLVSRCSVRCPAPNRSVNEFAVELSFFIGIPRSWDIDLRECPTRPPFTTASNIAVHEDCDLVSAALGFPTRYRAARFNGTKSNSRGSLSLGQMFCGFSKIQSVLGQV